MDQVLIEATDSASIEDRISQIISDCDIDYHPYFLAVAAAYGGLGDYEEALEQIHEDEEWLEVNTKLYAHVYDTLTEDSEPTEAQTEYMSEAFDDTLENWIVPMHYPL